MCEFQKCGRWPLDGIEVRRGSRAPYIPIPQLHTLGPSFDRPIWLPTIGPATPVGTTCAIQTNNTKTCETADLRTAWCGRFLRRRFICVVPCDSHFICVVPCDSQATDIEYTIEGLAASSVSATWGPTNTQQLQNF